MLFRSARFLRLLGLAAALVLIAACSVTIGSRDVGVPDILAALGGAEVQLRSHVAGALKTGSTGEEIVCALTHAGCYMGIPRLFNALNAVRDLLEEK